MRKILRKVTVTGADDSVNIDHLNKIYHEFPFVEFGILLSSSSEGNSRFPSKSWLSDFSQTELPRSGHLCGKIVRDLLKNGIWPCQYDEIHFDRYQINTHGTKHKVNLDKVAEEIRKQNESEIEIIFQYDNENNEVLNHCVSKGLNISALFDVSHGSGLLPKSWPKMLDISCGYAGGLSPNNVSENLKLIDPLIPIEKTTWIDAETHLRSLDDQIFEIDKVRKFLENALPYVIERNLQ